MNFNQNDAEKYRWTFAAMSVGYFFLAWFWIARAIRPTAFFGVTWIVMGVLTGSAAAYFIARHSSTSHTVQGGLEGSAPVTTMNFPTMSSRVHHSSPSRTKVSR